MVEASFIPHMLQEIREQADLLSLLSERSWNGYVRDDGTLRRRIWLVGCGDMAFGGEICAWITDGRLGTVHGIKSMDLRWAPISRGDTVIVSSISGRTHRTIEAAIIAKSLGAEVIGITDNADSELQKVAHRCVLLETAPRELLSRGDYAGYQYIVPQTKSFMGALWAMINVVEGCADHSRVVDVVRRAVPRLELSVAETEEFWRGGENVVCLGSGFHLPIARYVSAKFTEFAIPSIAQCLEEFNHLEMFVANESTRIVVFAGDRPSHSRALELIKSWERLGVHCLVWNLLEQGRIGDLSAQRALVDADDKMLSRFELVAIELISGQLSALTMAKELGRELDSWVGGCRTALIQSISQDTIRGSKIERTQNV